MARKKEDEMSGEAPGGEGLVDTGHESPTRPPQGLFPRTSETPHPTRKRFFLLDPDSLRVRRQRESGEEFLDDPYVAFPDDRGGYAITQVKAEHAARLLVCDEASGGPATCRLATDEEFGAERKITGPGGHGNLVGRK
jgi:hypothetical protein